MKIIAIVPIKHHSSRVPGKNYRLINGRPLFHYILETLCRCSSISRIIVDTNSPTIEEGVVKYFPAVEIFHRPEHLWDGDISTNILLTNVIKTLCLDADLYLHTHTTNPLLCWQTIEEAIEIFTKTNKINTTNKSGHRYDSLFSVSKMQTRLYRGNGEAYNHDPENLIPTQNLDPIYEENSCFYLVPAETVAKYGRRIGAHPLLYPIGKIEATDIDWEEDFQLAEYLLQMREREEKEKQKQRHAVIITGISGGIGRAIAEIFRRNGWLIIGIDRQKPADEKESDYFIQGDISGGAAEIAEIARIIPPEIRGKIAVLVNNAATQLNRRLITTEEAEWDYVMATNLRAVYLLAKEFYPELVANRGKVINMSSIHAINTSENIAAYAGSKAGMMGLTRAMALEFARDGIRVNAILPGAIDTAMLRDGLRRGHLGKSEETDATLIGKLGSRHVQGRIGKPKEIAEVVYFLAGEGSGFIVGQGIVVDGGASIRLSTE